MRNSLNFLAAGFMVVWVVLGVYLMRLWIAHRRLAERLNRLESEPNPLPEGPDTVG